MRQPVFFTLLLLIVGTFAACDSVGDTQPEPLGFSELLEIHLFEYFTHDAVRIEIDDHVVFEGVVTTGAFSSPASIIPVDLGTGQHQLVISVNDRVQGTTSFSLEDPLFIVVTYESQESSIRFDFLDSQPLYL